MCNSEPWRLAVSILALSGEAVWEGYEGLMPIAAADELVLVPVLATARVLLPETETGEEDAGWM